MLDRIVKYAIAKQKNRAAARQAIATVPCFDKLPSGL
jgi:hypothetical protein